MSLNLKSQPQKNRRILSTTLTELGALPGTAYKAMSESPSLFQSSISFKFKHSDSSVFLSLLLHYYAKENS